ncbi:sugar ABC transporter ATP-binding protein [Telluribacter sp.]|jgi:ribose transport system ATP-binding protein|uniref:sugar ABC transporter ATP-binding protein n=1 Tax=Telluribacter sp. TaxID=1978767 RepID=UPI002E14FB52|nr:sugar ABC transporter ATP-binding protein [Telluribacter sp.]
MLHLENISKSFPGVKALDGVSLEFKAGEVHAVCGENGAGKSTLMNIITGNYQPDGGRLVWNGEEIHIPDVQHGQRLGISIVYQERSLVDSLSVAENIYPINKPKYRWGIINYPALYQNTQQLLNRLQLNEFSPKTLVSSLSPAQKQMVEIAKALAMNPQLLILDEPTASITERETRLLFEIIKRLKEEGVAIIYISHRMAEIREIADRVSVLKDGKYQGTVVSRDTTIDTIIRLMVGRDMTHKVYASNAAGEVVLSVRNLSGAGFQNVNFQLNKGEILGFAGLVGAGRTEVAKALFGANPILSGEVILRDETVQINHPSEAIGLGIAYVPEDRKLSGLFLEKTIAENIASARLQDLFYEEDATVSTAQVLQQQLGIRTPSVRNKVMKLSGGNQQKVVLAKWLNTQPQILMVDEPTHGVDVGAKSEIYDILKTLTAEGKSIIMISSELPELLTMADRIAVMHEGRLVTILNKEEASEEKIIQIASGQNV